jgi:DNA polymerase
VHNCENFTQSVARSIVAEQALDISKQYPIVLLVHDEIVVLVPESEANDALDWCISIMRQAPSWCPNLPLDAEGKHSRCYSK